MGDQARVKRDRNDVIGPIAGALPMVSGRHFIGHVFPGQLRQGIGCRNFHGFIDRCCPDIQGAPKDVGKSQNIVDLIGIVGPSGCNDRIISDFGHFFRRDFRIWIGECKNNGFCCHIAHHIRCDRAFDRKADHHIGAFHGILQAARFGRHRMGGLPLIHAFFAAGIDWAFGITQNGIFMGQAHGFDQFQNGNPCGAGAIDHDLHVVKGPPGQIHGIDDSGGADDRRPVLIVVEHRDVHEFAQLLLNDKAFRTFDVFQVDAPERRAQIFHRIDEVIAILGIHLDVDGIYIRKTLEQHRLAFHHRF